MTKKTRTRLASKTVAENPRAPRARIAEGDADKLSSRAADAHKRNFRDVYGIHIPQLGRQGRSGHDELWTEVLDIVQETGIKTIPIEKKCKKAKWLSGEALQIAV